MSSDGTQRKLILGIIAAALLTWLAVMVDLERGGRPDPPALRAAATLLDGAWRFHTGASRWRSPRPGGSTMRASPGSICRP